MSRNALLVTLLASLLLAANVRADEPDPDDRPTVPKEARAEMEPIAWEPSYVAALKRAKSEGKPLLFKFYDGWCVHCARMDKTTWKDATVAKHATSFVAAKVNADIEKVPVSRYRLTAFPVVIIAEPGGEQVLRLEGYKDASVISAYLSAYIESEKEIHAAHATLASDKKNAGALLTIADFHAKVGLHDVAGDEYLKAAKVSTGTDLVRASAGAGSSLLKAGKAAQAAKALASGMTAAGEAPTPALMLAMAQLDAAQGKPDAAKTWYQRVVTEHATSTEAAVARKALEAPGG